MKAARLLPWLFWASVAIIFALAIMPHPPRPPGLPSDKVQHILAFIFLSAFAAITWPRASLLKIGLLLTGFGGLIELVQMIPVLHRYAEWADWVADTGAVIVTLGLVALWRRLKGRDSRARRTYVRQTESRGEAA